MVATPSIDVKRGSWKKFRGGDIAELNWLVFHLYILFGPRGRHIVNDGTVGAEETVNIPPS